MSLVNFYVLLHHCFEFWADWFIGGELEIEVNDNEIWLTEIKKQDQTKPRTSQSACRVLSAEEQQYPLLPEHFHSKSAHKGYGGMLLKAAPIPSA